MKKLIVMIFYGIFGCLSVLSQETAMFHIQKIKNIGNGCYELTAKANGEKYSAWTICKERAAIAKLYGEDCRSILKDAPERTRDDIKRSRGKDWTEVKPIEKQPDYEALGRAAGLRKADLSCRGHRYRHEP